MTTPPPRSYTGLTIAIVIGALIIGAAVYASSYVGKSTTSVSTSTSTPVQTMTGTTASSATSPDGLRLSASISATGIAVGQGITVALSIANTLPTTNTVRTEGDWQFTGIPVLEWPSCYYPNSAEMVILNGTYTAQELRAATSVTLRYTCAEDVSFDHIVFQPNSDQVNATGVYDVTNTNGTYGPYLLQFAFVSTGYWDLQALASDLNPPSLGENGNSPESIAFTPGAYTVAVEDEWGQVVVLPFTVSGPSMITTTETAAAISATTIIPQGTTYQVQSSYDCLAGHLAQPFNVSATSLLGGGMNATEPGVTVYVTTVQGAQTVTQGHPAAWLYASSLADSTSLNVDLAPGSYVLWIEGADLGCGASTVTPLEQLTTVTVTQAITLGPPGGGIVLPG